MSHEIYWVYTGSSTLYAQVRQGKQANQIWNTSGTPAFETYDTANIANYDIALTEQGTGSNFYSGNFPTGITTPGLYLITIHEQAGGSPAESDTILSVGDLHWNGTEARPVADTMWMNTGALSSNNAAIYLKSIDIESDSSDPALRVVNASSGHALLIDSAASATPAIQISSDANSGYAVSVTAENCGGMLISAGGTAVFAYSEANDCVKIQTEGSSTHAMLLDNAGNDGYAALQLTSSVGHGVGINAAASGIVLNATGYGIYVTSGDESIHLSDDVYVEGKLTVQEGTVLQNSTGPGLQVTSSHTSGYAATISSSTCGGLSVVSSASAGSAVLLQNDSTTPTVLIENNNGVALTIDSASDSAVELIASTYAIETADTIKCGALTVSGATTLSGGVTVTGGMSFSGDIDVYSSITLYAFIESYSYITIYGAVTVTGQVSLNDGLYITNSNGPGLSVTSTHTSGYAAEFTSTSCGGLLITGGDDEPCVKIEHESPSSLLPGAIDVVGEVFFRSEPYGYVEASPSPADDAFDGYNGNLSSTDDFYNGMFLVFQSGTLAGQARQISDYVGATQSFAFNGSGTDLDRPFTTAPSTDNRFIIVGLAKG